MIVVLTLTPNAAYTVETSNRATVTIEESKRTLTAP